MKCNVIGSYGELVHENDTYNILSIIQQLLLTLLNIARSSPAISTTYSILYEPYSRVLLGMFSTDLLVTMV